MNRVTLVSPCAARAADVRGPTASGVAFLMARHLRRSVLLLVVLAAIAPAAGAAPKALTPIAVREESALPTLQTQPSATPVAPVQAEGPRLALTWDAAVAQAGAPIGLTVEALAADGARDASRSGTVALFLDDSFAVAGGPGRAIDG